MDIIINIIGILYGITLILAAFVNGQLLDAMRLDTLFLPNPSGQTRPVNLVFGLLIAGYATYSLVGR